MSQTSAAHHEIAVVGAGPAGLLTALLLHQAGRDVVLVGPVQTADEHKRTAALLQGSVDLIKRAGAWEAVRPVATPLEIMTLVDVTGRLLAAPPVTFRADEMGESAFGYNVATADLSAALASAYEGAHLAHAVDAVEICEASVRLTLANGDAVTCERVIGADGRGSVVREGAGIGVKSWRYDQAAVVAVFEHEAPHENRSIEFHRKGGPFVLVPAGEKRSSVVYCDTPDAIDALAQTDDVAFAKALSEASQYTFGALRLVAPRQVYPLSSAVAEAFATPRVALVGDAAHAFPPIGAQGLNLGFRDVAALIAELAEGDGAFERYARARRADVLTRLGGVDVLNRSLLTEFLPLQLARSVGLSLVRSQKGVRRLMMREGMRPALAS